MFSCYKLWSGPLLVRSESRKGLAKTIARQRLEKRRLRLKYCRIGGLNIQQRFQFVCRRGCIAFEVVVHVNIDVARSKLLYPRRPSLNFVGAFAVYAIEFR